MELSDGASAQADEEHSLAMRKVRGFCVAIMFGAG